MDNSRWRVALRLACRGHRGVARMDKDLAYYRRRSAEETLAARSATNAAARTAHRELARLYDERTASLETLHRRAEVHLVSAA